MDNIARTRWTFDYNKVDISSSKVNISSSRVDIDSSIVDIIARAGWTLTTALWNFIARAR